MSIVVVKYNAGNAQSVLSALSRLGAEGVLSDDPEQIGSADRVIFPGVGQAKTAMNYLRECGLDKTLSSLSAPLLGICLGMQLLCEYSDEGETECLGLVSCRLRRFDDSSLIVPHMGWNQVKITPCPLFHDLPAEPFFYFAHSYFAPVCNCSIGITVYGSPFSAALNVRNFYGVQFHPEKSGEAGEQLLKNFLEL
jgi:glutamine amidotransferase